MTGPRVITVTPAQRAVIAELTCDGANSRDIADRLGTCAHSVDNQIGQVLRRTGLHSRTQLVVALMRGRLKLRTADRRESAA